MKRAYGSIHPCTNGLQPMGKDSAAHGSGHEGYSSDFVMFSYGNLTKPTAFV